MEGSLQLLASEKQRALWQWAADTQEARMQGDSVLACSAALPVSCERDQAALGRPPADSTASHCPWEAARQAVLASASTGHEQRAASSGRSSCPV